MNLNYAIFRSEPIMTIPDLAQIGSHNKQEKKAYQSNHNIKLELTKNNIELVPLNVKYVKGFDELVMTASHNFFKDMSGEQIKDWADTCMEFVYKDLGYKKEQVLHATVHLDEKTPQVHCVVVPLVKKLDKRTNTERYTISKKQYIKDKIHLSHLQELYHKRLIDKGYDLERGIKGSDNKHIKIKEYKQLTKKLNHELNVKNDRFDKAMSKFEEQMKTNKKIPFDNKHVILEKETFDSMNNVINESKRVMELQPKLKAVFNEVDGYANSYKSLEKENQKYRKEINKLEYDNQNLERKNRNLIYRLNYLFDLLKKFLRKLLQRGNDCTKDETVNIIKDCYDNDEFDMKDVVLMSVATTKQDELFGYVNAPNYLKERVRDYDEDEYDKDDFDMCR